MSNLGDRLSELLDILGGKATEEGFDIPFGFGFADLEGGDSAVERVFPFAVEGETGFHGEEGEEGPEDVG